MNFAIDVNELNRLTGEIVALRAQVTDLQERNTELVELNRAQSIRANVAQFHRVTDNPVLEYPQVPPRERCTLRMALIAEEFFEVAEAMYAGNPDVHWQLEVIRDSFTSIIEKYEPAPDVVALADGLCDLDYVVEGTRLEFGIDGAPVLAEAQKSNLSKTDAPRRSDGKTLKGPNYTPPDIARVLREQGWRG